MPAKPTNVGLPRARDAWGRDGFEQALKAELEGLPVAGLPLQQGLRSGSYALDVKFQVMFIGASADERCIRAKVGVFFSGLVAGCSCADDPTPVEPEPEYCELEVVIDRRSGAAQVALAGS